MKCKVKQTWNACRAESGLLWFILRNWCRIYSIHIPHGGVSRLVKDYTPRIHHHVNLGSNGFYMACKLSTHAGAYPNTFPLPKVPRCPHLTGNFSFPRSSAVSANVGSSRCSHAPMQHAAAHQQAVLHQGVAVDGISPLLFRIKNGLYI